MPLAIGRTLMPLGMLVALILFCVMSFTQRRSSLTMILTKVPIVLLSHNWYPFPPLPLPLPLSTLPSGTSSCACVRVRLPLSLSRSSPRSPQLWPARCCEATILMLLSSQPSLWCGLTSKSACQRGLTHILRCIASGQLPALRWGPSFGNGQLDMIPMPLTPGLPASWWRQDRRTSALRSSARMARCSPGTTTPTHGPRQ